MQHNIQDIKENLENARKNGRKCTLLIGAGSSVKANIPHASEFVKLIENKCPSTYERAEKKMYPQVMSHHTSGHKCDLIAPYIDDTKINMTHICIAMLIHEGYIDRVLTTNFDPLIIRACALLNEFPAVYDFAASQLSKPADMADKAVFHLHEQRDEFVLLNTEKECKDLSKHLEAVLSDSTQRRMWIVVGYGGDNDPVFDHLANINRFDYGLYWIDYKNNEPSKNVRERLLVEGKEAYFVKGYDVDSFFRDLTRELDIYPPDFISIPVTHMSRYFDKIASYSLSNDENGYDTIDTNFADMISWGYIGQGTAFCEDAVMKEGEEAEKLFNLAFEKYEAALKIRPDKHDALNNWGLAFYEEAKMKEGKEAEKLFNLAFEKYEAALKIKPDDHEVLNNWGTTLFDFAKMKEGKEAENLFNLAFEKYEAALKVKPDYYKVLHNWGTILLDLAKMKEGKEAENLFNLAFEKYEAALKIEPDSHEALYNWGTALLDIVKIKKGREAENLFNLIFEKYEAALNIEPDFYEVWYNWGTALSDFAKMNEGEKMENLFNLAFEKYEVALKIAPDSHEALYNWGTALLDLAKIKEGEEAERLFSESRKKLLQAENIKTGSAAYNLACLSALLNDDKSCREWLELAYESKSIPDVEHLNSDSDLDSVRETDWFREIVANMMAQK